MKDTQKLLSEARAVRRQSQKAVRGVNHFMEVLTKSIEKTSHRQTILFSLDTATNTLKLRRVR